MNQRTEAGVSQASINGATLTWREAGAGSDLLVLVHGFPFNSAQWRPQLQAPPSGWRVIAPDLRGFGGSGPVPGNKLPMDLFAADLAGLVAHLGVRNAVFCGHSMGGYVLFSLVRQHPGLVRGLILCDTRAGADSDEGRQGRVKNAQHVHAHGTASLVDAMVPRLLSAQTRQKQPQVEQEMRSIMTAAPVPGVAGALLGMAERPDSTPLLRSIDVPTLAIAGENDEITPVGEARLMARAIRGAICEIVPESGHVPNLEQPADFNRHTANFLSGRFTTA